MEKETLRPDLSIANEKKWYYIKYKSEEYGVLVKGVKAKNARVFRKKVLVLDPEGQRYFHSSQEYMYNGPVNGVVEFRAATTREKLLLFRAMFRYALSRIWRF